MRSLQKDQGHTIQGKTEAVPQLEPREETHTAPCTPAPRTVISWGMGNTQFCALKAPGGAGDTQLRTPPVRGGRGDPGSGGGCPREPVGLGQVCGLGDGVEPMLVSWFWQMYCGCTRC